MIQSDRRLYSNKIILTSSTYKKCSTVTIRRYHYLLKVSRSIKLDKEGHNKAGTEIQTRVSKVSGNTTILLPLLAPEIDRVTFLLVLYLPVSISQHEMFEVLGSLSLNKRLLSTPMINEG